MIRFKKVTFSNFMSFGQQPFTVDLDTKKTHVILGRNEDIGEKGSSANGVGKTTMIVAIIYALYGHGIEKIKADEFINIVNERKLVVELEFMDGDTLYKIRRGRKPNFLELYVHDGDEFVSYTLDAMRNTDEMIESIVGGYDMFMTSYFLSPHRKSFMSMTAPEQRAMIEGMLSLDTLAKRAESVKLIRSEVATEIKVLERDIERDIAANAATNRRIAQLEQSEQKFRKDQEESKKSIQEQLDDLSSIDINVLYEIYDEWLESKKFLEKKNSQLRMLSDRAEKRLKLTSKLKSAVSSLEKSKLASEKFVLNSIQRKKDSQEVIDGEESEDVLASELERLESLQRDFVNNSARKRELTFQKNTLSKELALKIREFDGISKELDGHVSGTCPTCGSDFDDSEHLSSLEEKRFSLEKSVSSLKSDILLVENEIDAIQIKDFSDDISDLKSRMNRLKDAVRFVLSVDTEQNPYTTEVATKESEVSQLEEEIRELEDGTDESLTMAAIDDSIKDMKESLAEYDEILKHYRISDRSHIEKLSDEIEALKERIAEDKENPYTALIDDARGEIVDVASKEDELSNLVKKEKHAGYLVKLLTDSKSFVRRRILDNYIPYLNKKINEYTAELGLSHICEVNSDLSVDITYMSRPVTYHLMSRGEKLRLDTAITRAFRDMVSLLGKGSNLLLVDEVFDSGLDASGVNKCLRFVRETAETVLLVSHKEEICSSIDDKICVVKRNGFSSIE